MSPCNHLVDNFGQRFACIDDDCILWFFERRELAFHQFFREKMGRSMLQSVADRLLIDVKIDKFRGNCLIA